MPQAMVSKVSFNVVHPNGHAKLPGGFGVVGINGVAVEVGVKYLLNTSFRLVIKIGSYTSSIDARRIGELRDVMRGMMDDTVEGRRHNFSFRGATLSVFAASRGESGSRQLVMCSVSAACLSEEQVVDFLAELDHVAEGLDEFAASRGVSSPICPRLSLVSKVG